MTKKFEWFCKSHDQALCVTCLPSEHKSCSDVIPIDVAATNARQSTAISDLQEAIEVTLRNITLCINNRNTATKDIEKQEKDIRTIIRNTRTKINGHLDELEEKLMQTLVSATKTCKSSSSNLLQQLNIREKRLITLKDQLLQMKNFASELQVFLGTRQIDKLVMSEIKSIKTVSNSLYDYKFNLVLNDDIQNLSNCAVKEFGGIKTTEHASNIVMKELKIEQAQVQQNLQPSGNVKLEVIAMVDIKKEEHMCITGCAILPNGHLLFANYTYKQKLLEYSEEGTYIGSIPVSAIPYDITVLDSDRIAITYLDKEFFEIFNYRKSQVEKKIKTECWGLSYSNGKIYIKLDKVAVYNIKGKKLCSLAILGEEDSCYISASENKVFCSNEQNGSVCCYDIKGQKVWKFHDNSLMHTCGVATDDSGNVFVASRVPKNIILIQNDGKTYRNLLNLNEYSSPRTVCYNKDNNTLLYCDAFGRHCALYKVLYN
ncbi:unnamed protein product [Mytilus edulis]|uniref:B box-type domain-containing protein n=1 Tax=Mytilus edulis TaxID=6550 RepID=A0A8S3V4D2_MYTED|nr:unnamed protein product [Mytilus edulis]